MAIDDIYTQGIAAGWSVRDASTLSADAVLETEVAIVGSGAGGGMAAEILTAAGLNVLMIEEGALYTAADFKDMDEWRGFSTLYQEGAGRMTADGAVYVFQGRAVGGSTTVNWTTSLRTPDPTLEHWAQAYALRDSTPADLAPWFARCEERLGIAPWAMEPNRNNALLRDGCARLGWSWKTIPRNVRGCWNLGYCGLGCPTNAKQSMLVTTIPQALRRGMTLLHHARAEALHFSANGVAALTVRALGKDARTPTGVTLTVKARHYVLAAGAINTPALLLRSRAPDPRGLIGRRTCIHPVNASLALFDEPVHGFHGAPQSIYSDHFLWPAQGLGYKLEVPPLQPVLMSGIFGSHGERLSLDMRQLDHAQVCIALMRDGFDAATSGGRVRIDAQGQPLLDYPLTEALWDGLRRAYLSMAEVQFAAGARSVRPVHLDGHDYRSWDEARRAIAFLPMRAQRATLYTAHLMGGCPMGEDKTRCVIDSRGRHHEIENLSIFDGSMFPTSIGANPQLSIYAFVARNATALADSLTPRRSASTDTAGVSAARHDAGGHRHAEA
ncbi:GMC oxidoreductase [Fontimonas thermophila]|uniref:GMC oxidoreductase n=1 Tax=Fontimonas thermophila TaxID=1076937 RepID=A0A1I2JT82_9GAMM|nr:GMC family oxidoreductase [Fontimonas thermophila]SFF57804.1 GMC oxidoreductase [Fontimonas thermophila]